MQKSSFEQLLENYHYFLFDCDGVLYSGSHAIPGSFEKLEEIKKAGKKAFFITNSSARSRRMMVEKLAKYGYEATEDQIYGSAYIAAQYIKNNFPEVKKAYVVAMDGVKEEL